MEIKSTELIIMTNSELRSFSHTKTNRKTLDLLSEKGLQNKKILDVGAGEGYFSQLLGDRLEQLNATPVDQYLHACDMNPQDYKYDKVQCQEVQLHGQLPYDENSFDYVVCIEVIEHVESQFHLVKELYRVTKPGGFTIVTTPNILNINSRFHAFYSGFPLLYNPLPLDSDQPVMTNGHIHPISIYYLLHMFSRTGFSKLECHYDKKKKSSAIYLPVFYPLIKLSERFYLNKFKRKQPDLFNQNKHLIPFINSIDTLMARTIMVMGQK